MRCQQTKVKKQENRLTITFVSQLFGPDIYFLSRIGKKIKSLFISTLFYIILQLEGGFNLIYF